MIRLNDIFLVKNLQLIHSFSLSDTETGRIASAVEFVAAGIGARQNPASSPMSRKLSWSTSLSDSVEESKAALLENGPYSSRFRRCVCRFGCLCSCCRCCCCCWPWNRGLYRLLVALCTWSWLINDSIKSASQLGRHILTSRHPEKVKKLFLLMM